MTTIWINSMHSCQRDIAALIRRGSSGGIRTVSSHKDDREDIFMTADESFVEPAFKGDNAGARYAAWAMDRAIDGGWKGVIAMRWARELANYREVFASTGIRIAVGAMSATSIALCDDKYRFTKDMADAGIPVARTLPTFDRDMVRSAILEIEGSGHAACIKPRKGVYGQGYWKFTRGFPAFARLSDRECLEIDPEEYLATFPDDDHAPEMVVMQHLPGIETSIDCVCDNGRVIAHAVRQKHADRQVISTRGPEFEIAAAVAGKLRLDGLVNVQTKADGKGRPHILEVNPRPSGGVGYAAVAGINLPHAAASMLLGREVKDIHLPDPVVVRRVDLPVMLPRATHAIARGAG